MKSFTVLGFAVALWGVSVMSTAAWGDSIRSAPSRGGRGASCTGIRYPGQPNFNTGIRYPGQPNINLGRRHFDPGSGFDRRRDHHRRRCNDCGDNGGGFVYWGGGDPYYPYGPDYRLNYSVNTPSPQSNSPYQIALNDGVHLSPLDSGYPGPAPAVGEFSYPAAVAPAPAAPAAASLNVDVVVGVQRELRRRGYYRGVVNGISDGTTRAAIRAYEANMGLPVTGVIGVSLIRSLGFF